MRRACSGVCGQAVDPAPTPIQGTGYGSITQNKPNPDRRTFRKTAGTGTRNSIWPSGMPAKQVETREGVGVDDDQTQSDNFPRRQTPERRTIGMPQRASPRGGGFCGKASTEPAYQRIATE